MHFSFLICSCYDIISLVYKLWWNGMENEIYWTFYITQNLQPHAKHCGKNTIPVLQMWRIEALADGISFKATDMDTEITEIVDAKIVEKGATTAPTHMLYDITRKLSDGSEVGLTQMTRSTHNFFRKILNFRFFLHWRRRLPCDFWWQTPVEFVISKEEFKDVIDRTKFAVSTEETRYYLNGIYMHANEDWSKSPSRCCRRWSPFSLCWKSFARLKIARWHYHSSQDRCWS